MDRGGQGQRKSLGAAGRVSQVRIRSSKGGVRAFFKGIHKPWSMEMQPDPNFLVFVGLRGCLFFVSALECCFLDGFLERS